MSDPSTQTQNLSLQQWEKDLVEKIKNIQKHDSAHDEGHTRRVVQMAQHIGKIEGADLFVVTTAAYLHDVFNAPKDDEIERKAASHISAELAWAMLTTMGISFRVKKAVYHAIEAHSFSAKIEPTTIEAKVVQDADRLDALGAIGIMRCAAVSGSMKRSLLHQEDPLALSRIPDDNEYALDHFFKKLYLLPDLMNTQEGKRIATERFKFMLNFVHQLTEETKGFL